MDNSGFFLEGDTLGFEKRNFAGIIAGKHIGREVSGVKEGNIRSYG